MKEKIIHVPSRKPLCSQIDLSLWSVWPDFLNWGSIILLKSSPNVECHFGLFWKHHFSSKTALATFWSSFGKIWATFYFITRSHCLWSSCFPFLRVPSRYGVVRYCLDKLRKQTALALIKLETQSASSPKYFVDQKLLHLKEKYICDQRIVFPQMPLPPFSGCHLDANTHWWPILQEVFIKQSFSCHSN